MIDLRTFLTIFAVADLLAAAALWMGVGRGTRDGLSHWACALVLRALAAVLCVAGAAHLEGALAVATGLIAVSLTLQAGSLAAFGHRALPTWVHTAVLAAVAIPVQLVERDASLVILFSGIVLGVLMLGIAALARGALPAGAARRLMIGSFLAAGCAMVARGVGSGFDSNATLALLAPVGLPAAALLLVFAAMECATIAFLFLHKERAEAHALRLAHLDTLTGAYNRRAFRELAGREMERARRAGQPMSMLMLDIDHFGDAAQRFGADTADALLVRFVEVMLGALRKEDLLFRFGGDQFLAVLPGISGPGAVVAAGRLRRLMAANALRAAGQDIAITVSIGVSARLDEGAGSAETLETLLDRATSALDLAKHRGRDRVVALSLGSSLAA